MWYTKQYTLHAIDTWVSEKFKWFKEKVTASDGGVNCKQSKVPIEFPMEVPMEVTMEAPIEIPI